MTRLRKRPTQRFIAFFVKPTSGFNPKSWQDVPENYQVIDYIGPMQFRGRADAWRFMENKAVLDENDRDYENTRTDTIEKWAVVIS